MKNYGMRTFDNVNKIKVESILRVLSDHGALVTGNNPWQVDTRNHGVVLQGAWDSARSQLSITVIDAAWYVPSGKVWDNLESLMQSLQEGA